MKDNKQQKSVNADDLFRKGLWSNEEDKMLVDYVNTHGKGHWNSVSKKTGLKRSGKSCRLRWMNYLSPTVKRERFTEDEEDLIIRLHSLLGNRWALIAGRVPGRTDNQVKNHWNTHLSKKNLSKGVPSAPSQCEPATTHSGKLKTCCSNNLRKSVTEDQAISSDFSSNTVYGTKSSIDIPKETASREETRETTRKSNQLHAREDSDAGQVEQTGAAAAAAAAAGDGDNDQGCCFMQYFDDYTLNFVLSNNQRNVAAAVV